MVAQSVLGIGHHLGEPGAQNPQQELLGEVRDYREDDPASGCIERLITSICTVMRLTWWDCCVCKPLSAEGTVASLVQ